MLRRRYETLFRHAPAGYLTLSLDGWVVDANLRAFDMLKRDAAALLEQPMRNFLAPESVAAFDDLLAACIENAGDVSADNLLMSRPRAVPIYTKAQGRRIDFGDLQPPVIVLAIMDDVVRSIQR